MSSRKTAVDILQLKCNQMHEAMLYESISCIDNQIPCGSPGNLMQLEEGENVSAFCIASVAPPSTGPIGYGERIQESDVCVVVSAHSREEILVCLWFHLRVLSLFQVWQESGSRPKL